MSLDSTNADSVATAYCAENGITDADAIAKWKSLTRYIYYLNSGSIKTALSVTLPAMSVVTTGGPATQTGPAVPVAITVA